MQKAGMFMKIKTILFITALTLSLSACMSMPFSTMYKMSQFSPLDIKPHELRVAIRTDEAISIQNGAVKVSLNVGSEGMPMPDGTFQTSNDEFGPFDINLNMNVQISSETETSLPPFLLEGIEDKERVTVLNLSDEDAQSMADTLALIRLYKAQGLKPHGGFGISTQAQCFGDFSAFEELEVDIFIQVDKQEGYIMFLEDIDIIEEANDREVDLLTPNKCE
ncbi:MAG: hypothetical protein ACI9O6_000184 [Glaciecola sp.]